MQSKEVTVMIIAGCQESVELAKKIARRTKSNFTSMNIGYFPDGETHLRFRKDVKGQHVVLIQTLFPANENIIEALFAAYTARDIGAKKVTLVAPYLAYMREDIRFHKGECISAKVLGKMLSAAFDKIITIDPHLHRFKSMNEVFTIPSKKLTTSTLMGEFVRKNIKNGVVIGPDGESFQWALKVAKVAGMSADVLTKTRYSSTHVQTHFKSGANYRGKRIVIVDDIISTGHTMMETIKQLKRMKVKEIVCVATHGLFTDNAYPKMKRLGVCVYTSNTITHETNLIDVSGLISSALTR